AAAAAVGDHLVACQIVLRHRLLPLEPPSRRSLRRPRALDRTAVGLHRTQVASTDEAMRPVIEIVAVEFIDAHPDGTRGDEGIEYLVVEEAVHARRDLIRIIAPDHALAGVRIVGLADSGEQKQLDVEQLKGTEQHEAGRPRPFIATGVYICYAGGALS